jgi:GTP cyclohydrolase I
VNVFARRLQIQEQLTEQISDAIFKAIKPKGVAVIIDARHMCMEMRGVQKTCSSTVTTSLRGVFKDDRKTKDDFLNLIK